MSSKFDYFAQIQHLPDAVQEEIKALPYERRKRLLILADLGINLTMEHIIEYKSLKKRNRH